MPSDALISRNFRKWSLGFQLRQFQYNTSLQCIFADAETSSLILEINNEFFENSFYYILMKVKNHLFYDLNSLFWPSNIIKVSGLLDENEKWVERLFRRWKGKISIHRNWTLSRIDYGINLSDYFLMFMHKTDFRTSRRTRKIIGWTTGKRKK